MALDLCHINLNSDSTGSFYTGDIVTGSIVLEFKNELKIEQIKFKVIGKVKAQWTRPMPTIPYIKIYSEKKKVLDLDLNVFEDFDGKTIQPGIYNLHFHFTLPNDLPSTFESSIAKVHYYVKIEAKAAHMLRRTRIEPLIVLGNINLNNSDDYLVPSIYEFRKTISSSKVFRIVVNTYRGFASKQTVPFGIEIDNEKKVKINKLLISLIQKLEYCISSGFTKDEKVMCKVQQKKFLHTTNETCQLNMDIPHLIPSSLNLIDPMIHISYVFRVEVIFSFRCSLYEDIPVTVATVPVMHYDFDEVIKR